MLDVKDINLTKSDAGPSADHPDRVGTRKRWKKYLPVATFAAGFVWDSWTLTRIDEWSDNLILIAYLAALAAMIFITLRRQGGVIQVAWLVKLESHFTWIIQFLLGGLLSRYVIYYSQSASWTETEFFFILLVLILIGNEFLQHRLNNEKLLAVLFFFCLSSFLTFFLPIVLAKVARWIFLLAGALSLVLSLWLFAHAIPAADGNWRKRMGSVSLCILTTYILLNIFYFANLIPPVPLALKESGIYHQVVRTRAGYEVQYVQPPSYRFWQKSDDPFYAATGESAYCYTAIFAPRKIRIPIHHVWSRYSISAGWSVTDRISFEISGGREGGYRGYSQKKLIKPGRWRVEVVTDQGQILGRIYFDVDEIQTPFSRTTRLIR